MISPPFGTKAYYGMTLRGKCAEAAFQYLIEEADLIGSVMVISSDMESDIAAVAELQKAAETISKLGVQEIETALSFNTLYLPHAQELDVKEADEVEGALQIGSFVNPYVVAVLNDPFNSEGDMDGVVMFKQFELPDLNVAVSPGGALN